MAEAAGGGAAGRRRGAFLAEASGLHSVSTHLVSRARLDAHNHHNSASTPSQRLCVPLHLADQLTMRYVA